MLYPWEAFLFTEVARAKTLTNRAALKIKETSRNLCDTALFSFPVGCELLNRGNYQSLWLETICFLPDTENAEKPASFLPWGLYNFFVTSLVSVTAEKITMLCFTDSVFKFLTRVFILNTWLGLLSIRKQMDWTTLILYQLLTSYS